MFRFSPSTTYVTRMAVLRIAQRHDRIRISEVAEQTGLTDDEVIECIKWGSKRGIHFEIEGDEIVNLRGRHDLHRETGVVYMVVCPNCGTKNVQGISKCENCGAPL